MLKIWKRTLADVSQKLVVNLTVPHAVLVTFLIQDSFEKITSDTG
jgi:hypothetical protein